MEDSAVLGAVLGGLALLVALGNGIWGLITKATKGGTDKLEELTRRINSHAARIKELETEAARMEGARVEERLRESEEAIRTIQDELKGYAHDLDLGVERLQTVKNMIDHLRIELRDRE